MIEISSNIRMFVVVVRFFRRCLVHRLPESHVPQSVGLLQLWTTMRQLCCMLRQHHYCYVAALCTSPTGGVSAPNMCARWHYRSRRDEDLPNRLSTDPLINDPILPSAQAPRPHKSSYFRESSLEVALQFSSSRASSASPQLDFS